MIKIPFYTFTERSPSHNQEVIYLTKVSVFDQEGFEPREGIVEYSWEDYDKDGSREGSSSCYIEEYDGTPPLGAIIKNEDGSYCKLECIVDGYYSEDISYWTPVDEYHSAFDIELPCEFNEL